MIRARAQRQAGPTRSSHGAPPPKRIIESLDVAPNGDTVPLDVTHLEPIDLARARAALRVPDWLGQAMDAPLDAGWIRIATDLALPVRDGSGAAVRKAALIDLGEVRATDDGMTVPIAWSSATLTPLFPVFAGRIDITRSGLVLAGRYAPPFGKLGLLMNQGLLHLVAVRTAQAFLGRVAAQCAEDSGRGDEG